MLIPKHQITKYKLKNNHPNQNYFTIIRFMQIMHATLLQDQYNKYDLKNLH